LEATNETSCYSVIAAPKFQRERSQSGLSISTLLPLGRRQFIIGLRIPSFERGIEPQQSRKPAHGVRSFAARGGNSLTTFDEWR
jgi:hypothetical protein